MKLFSLKNGYASIYRKDCKKTIPKLGKCKHVISGYHEDACFVNAKHHISTEWFIQSMQVTYIELFYFSYLSFFF